MKKKQLRELAEAHYIYTEGIIDRSMNFEKMDYEQLTGLCSYLYIESMIHGYKHCKDEVLVILKDETITIERKIELVGGLGTE